MRWPLAIYAVFCAAAGLVALRFLPRADADDAAAPSRPRGLAATWRSTRDLCADPAFIAALVMMAASRWASTGVRFSLVPVFGDEVVGASSTVVGVALTLASATHLAVLWPTGKLADTLGRRAVGGPAYLAFAVIAAALAWATTVPLFLLAMGMYGVGTGLTSVTPPAVVADVVPDERTGVGIGILNTAGDLGSVVGPLVSGLAAERLGYGWGFGASAAPLAVGGLVALGMRETAPGRQGPARAGVP